MPTPGATATTTKQEGPLKVASETSLNRLNFQQNDGQNVFRIVDIVDQNMSLYALIIFLQCHALHTTFIPPTFGDFNFREWVSAGHTRLHRDPTHWFFPRLAYYPWKSLIINSTRLPGKLLLARQCNSILIGWWCSHFNRRNGNPHELRAGGRTVAGRPATSAYQTHWLYWYIDIFVSYMVYECIRHIIR